MRTHASLDNDQLVRRFLDSGDPTLFRVLFERTVPAVVRLARRRAVPSTELDDLVQEVYFGVLTGLPRFTFSSEFETWVCGIAKNKIAMRRRRRAQRQLPRASRPGVGPSLDEELEFAEARGQLRAAVESLPDGYRSVIELRFLSGLEVSEIADRLGTPESTVRTRLSRGLQQLRDRVPAHFLALLLVSLGLERLIATQRLADAATPAGRAGVGGKLVAAGGAVAAILLTVLALDMAEPSGSTAAEPAFRAVSGRPPLEEPPVPEFFEGRRSRSEATSSPEAEPAEEGVRIVFVDFDGRRLPHLVVGIQTMHSDPGLSSEDMRAGFRPIRSDENGEHLLEVVPSGVVRFQFSAGDGSGSYRLDGAEQVRVVVGRAATFEGHVLGSDGRPVGGAEVWVTQAAFASEVPHVVAARSDARGAFRFSVAGTYTRLAWALDGTGRRSELGLLDVKPAFTGGLELVLREASGGLRGRVVDAGGEPAAGARVAASHHTAADRHLDYTEADEDGRFELAGLLPGTYQVYARSSDGASLRRLIHVEDRVVEAELRLETGGRVRGVLVDPNGNPIAGAAIGVAPGPRAGEPTLPWLLWGSALSEPDGSFVVEGIRRGPATLVALDPALGVLVAVDDGLQLDADELVCSPRPLAIGGEEPTRVSAACSRFAGRFARMLSWHFADPTESPSAARRRLRAQGFFLREE